MEQGLAVLPEKHSMRFRCDNGYTNASLRRMRLMRHHNLSKIFPLGTHFFLKRQNYRQISCVVPYFVHPHDSWMAENDLLETYSGKVIVVSFDEKIYHLLVELAPNVLAFAEVSSFDGNKDVKFIPYKYNSHTKRIYGCVYDEQTAKPERQLSSGTI
jgi:hypothetical protein